MRSKSWLVVASIVVGTVEVACSSGGSPAPSTGSPNGNTGTSGSSASGSGSSVSSGAGNTSGSPSLSGSNAGSGRAGTASSSGAPSSGSSQVPVVPTDDGGTMSDSSGSPPPGPTPMGPDPTSASASKQGPYKVTSYTMGIPSSMNYVTPTIYYSDAPGAGPGVVVIPGFTETQGALSEWGTFLASYGFVVMMIDTASGGVANTSILPTNRAASALSSGHRRIGPMRPGGEFRLGVRVQPAGTCG